jgi:uncharacterized membrane protein
MLRGTLFAPVFYLSLSGAIVATIFMTVAYFTKSFTAFGISASSALGFAIGQIIATT